MGYKAYVPFPLLGTRATRIGVSSSTELYPITCIPFPSVASPYSHIHVKFLWTTRRYSRCLSLKSEELSLKLVRVIKYMRNR